MANKNITDEYIREVFTRIRKQIDLFGDSQEDLLEMKKSIRQIMNETLSMLKEDPNKFVKTRKWWYEEKKHRVT